MWEDVSFYSIHTNTRQFYLLALSSLIKQALISEISSCDTKVSLFGLPIQLWSFVKSKEKKPSYADDLGLFKENNLTIFCQYQPHRKIVAIEHNSAFVHCLFFWDLHNWSQGKERPVTGYYVIAALICIVFFLTPFSIKFTWQRRYFFVQSC